MALFSFAVDVRADRAVNLAQHPGNEVSTQAHSFIRAKRAIVLRHIMDGVVPSNVIPETKVALPT